MEERLIPIKKTARIIIAGNHQAKIAVVVLHGYGEMSNTFLKNIQIDSKIFWLAPEALNRFYLEGFSGKVGASWMTKELRNTDIKDNLDYLEEVWSEFKLKEKFEKVILLGFSQGGATAIRFAYQFFNKIDGLIVWASDFPNELESVFNDKTSHLKKIFVIGNNDPFFKSERQEKLKKELSNQGFKIISYCGKHSIDHLVLNEIIASF
ncbi:alpha/beta hydrolase [Flavobacterium oreochromis]|uniref:Phospholipase/carboxylesterase/thioesterase domain-containing protein n=2 Tax=Flavobacterium TaxID=237 RepID=A0A246G974_9FLAO|nr:dienelactone hydrolase family protein [Flavobacterium oreochromis]OWP75941.1 hypothetical protein BWK62_10810 [Flavobacterium oreochromis]OWP77865.1 hypothetical protein BWG23_03565 [Flavobacterium oreochromis]POR30646.1 hypothetical protein BWK58_01280 [Flavobacterium columnare]QYS85587.1 dienelactone hydrolase family protein [Flavobacterium oreochromis]